jgi:hypothetical protein
LITINLHVTYEYYNLLNIHKTQKNATNLIADVHQPLKKEKTQQLIPLLISFVVGFLIKNWPFSRTISYSNLTLYITKGYHLLNSIKNVWLWRLILWEYSWIVFPSRWQLFNVAMFNMVNITMEQHVLLAFIGITIIIATFYLWMSQSGLEFFSLVVNYIKKVGTMSCYLWGSLDLRSYHGYTIEGIAYSFWTMWQGCYICERWRWQFEHIHNYSNKKNHMCSIGDNIVIFCYLLLSCYVQMFAICY